MTARTHTLLAAALLLCGCVAEVSNDPPVALTSITPAKFSARGGTALTLKGQHFTNTTTVQVGGVQAKVELKSATELKVFAPAMMAGPAELKATAGGGVETVLKGGVEVTPMELQFVEAAPYAVPLEADQVVTSAAAKDFDGDGTVDLFLCSGKTECRLLHNDGRANFFVPEVDAGTDAGVDAGTDAGRPADAGVVVDAGAADAGGFFPTEEIPLPKPVFGKVLAADDLDGDGDVDLLMALNDGGTQVSTNDGLGHFTPHGSLFSSMDADGGFVPAKPVTATVLVDLDGDGAKDLVTAGATPEQGPFRVDLNISTRDTPAFMPAVTSLTPRDYTVTAMVVADVDRDLKLDVVLATTGGDGLGLRVFLNRNGEFIEVTGGLPGVGPFTALAAADLDGDGAADLVAVGVGADRLLLNDGSGHFFDASAINLPLDGSAGTSVVLADLDRDRDLDLVVGNTAATMRLYVNDGRGKFQDRTPALPPRVESVLWLGAANVDGDSDEDLVVLTNQAAAVRVYLSVEPR